MKNVQAKIDAYTQVAESKQKGRAAALDRAAALETELAQARAELQEAMDDTIASPTAANEAAEVKLRKKVAELELALTGARERSRHASIGGMRETRRLAIDAIRTARAYVDDEWAAGRPAKLQAIADAKKAYLQALTEYGEWKRELQQVFMDTARETNPNFIDEAGGTPYLPDPAWNYRDHPSADGHLYSVTPHDVNRALKGELRI